MKYKYCVYGIREVCLVSIELHDSGKLLHGAYGQFCGSHQLGIPSTTQLPSQKLLVSNLHSEDLAVSLSSLACHEDIQLLVHNIHFEDLAIPFSLLPGFCR